MGADRILMLSDLKPFQEGEVINIRARSVQELHRLLQAGVQLKSHVIVLQSNEKHVLFIANIKEIAVDQEIASGIFVGSDQ
jgi:hypothetical protein